MVRPREGWKLRKPKGARCWSVRFTLPGRGQVERGTGEEDPELASVEAERIYTTELRGEYARKRRPAVQRGQDLRESAAQWLSAVSGSTLDEQTADTYALYFSTHFGTFFGTLDAVTPARAAEYMRHRLRSVKGATVRKELSCLRGFLLWAAESGRIADVPTVPSVPKRVTGTPHPRGKREHTELSPAEVKALLAELPERSPGGWPVRARFVVAYETTLRPETLNRLSVPEHYQRGGKWLRLEAQHDKARFGRRVPLSIEARRALDKLDAKPGLIFGQHDYRWYLEKAAAEALPAAKAKTFHAYDLRAAGITHRLEAGAPIPGVQGLAGHKSVATTARYVRVSERAMLEAISPRRRR